MSDMRSHLRTRHHTEQAILQFPEADQEVVAHDVSGFSNAMKAVASENEVATQVTVDLFFFLYTEVMYVRYEYLYMGSGLGDCVFESQTSSSVDWRYKYPNYNPSTIY